jgi:putative ATPase
LYAEHTKAELIALSAVSAGISEIRAAANRARANRQQGQATLVFVDEVHRFNKGQQDAFLPHIEEGAFSFVGATTENPSFELNRALLSRLHIYRLKALPDDALERLLLRGVHVLGNCELSTDGLRQLIVTSGGDGRRALNILQVAHNMVKSPAIGATSPSVLDAACISAAAGASAPHFDKQGDAFYDAISALHKAIRGSSPDAALYWCARMLISGCDPLYIARRLVRVASEDIGNADPRALTLALNAWDVLERLGSPEGDLVLSQAVSYLAVAPKSAAVYVAHKRAREYAARYDRAEVPLHLRNAPTALMRESGYGQGYRYSHDEPEGYSPGQRYWPDDVPGSCFYEPVNRGLEQQISAKLQELKRLDDLTEGVP